MPESLDAYNELDQIRREIKRLGKSVDVVASRVQEVEHKVDRSRATQLGALAATLAKDGGAPPEATLRAAGMNIADIAAALGKSENAVRLSLRRARRRG
jgi:hypothetical protein